MKDNEIMNDVYSLIVPVTGEAIQDTVELLLPDLSKNDQKNLSNELNKMIVDIDSYFLNGYTTNDEEQNKKFQENSIKWLTEKYPWLNDDNINRSINRGMYMAWHG